MEMGFPPASRLQISARICAVLTTGAVATGEVNFIVRLRSLPLFAETINHGYCSAAQRLAKLRG